MKKIIFTIMVLLTVGPKVLCCEGGKGRIVSYSDEHRDAVMEIVFQDPFNFFGGSSAVKDGLISKDLFLSLSKEDFESRLNNSAVVKNVILDAGRVIGFVGYFRGREQSLESIIRITQEKGFPVDEKAMATVMPGIKRTDAECSCFAKIDAVIVDEGYRRRGYGKALLEYAIDFIKRSWPSIKKIQLDVKATNNSAINLYKSYGFFQSSVQSPMLTSMGVLWYEKLLD